MNRYWLALFGFAAISFSFVWAQTPSEFKGHEGLIHSVAFSSDGAAWSRVEATIDVPPMR